ncbi:arginine decarboxylase [Pseudoscourfieldia marina]
MVKTNTSQPRSVGVAKCVFGHNNSTLLARRSTARLRFSPQNTKRPRRSASCTDNNTQAAPLAAIPTNYEQLHDTHAAPSSWTAEDGERLYNVQAWAGGFYRGDEHGQMCVSLSSEGDDDGIPLATPRDGDNDGDAVPLRDVVSQARALGAQTPMVIRIPHIAKRRAERLQESFARAWERFGSEDVLTGNHDAIFPVKCQPSMHVLDNAGNAGLEVGSKPELIRATLQLHRRCEGNGVARDDPPWLVCNGPKDGAYITAASAVHRAGLANVAVVLESVDDVSAAIAALPDGGDLPLMGVRLQLRSRHGGRYGVTSGDGSKFGLNAADILSTLARLENEAPHLLARLQVLHYHAGSQFPSIANVKAAAREASQFYVELRRRGVPLRAVDIGGGLAVDYAGAYDGLSAHSRDYHADQYASDVVAAFVDAVRATSGNEPCGGANHLTILTEAGRWTASHSAVVVFRAAPSTPPSLRDLEEKCAASLECAGLGCSNNDEHRGCGSVGAAENLLKALAEDAFEPLHEASVDPDGVVPRAPARWSRVATEALADAEQLRDEVRVLFDLGLASLEQRAAAEVCRDAVHARASVVLAAAQAASQEKTKEGRSAISAPMTRDPPSPRRCAASLSVFRSLPDSWAISQLFPIVPLCHLDQPPASYVRFIDATCDSDGVLNQYVWWPEALAASLGRDDNQTQSSKSVGLLRSLSESNGLVHDGLPVPNYQFDGAEPLFGAFLTGAYQESLGSKHNLFGPADEVVLHATGDVSIASLGARSGDMGSEDDEKDITCMDGALGDAMRTLADTSTYPNEM